MSSHRLAVLSDVHGNVWALEAVLADIRRRGATRARRNGRPDWAEWIETGRARLPC